MPSKNSERCHLLLVAGGCNSLSPGGNCSAQNSSRAKNVRRRNNVYAYQLVHSLQWVGILQWMLAVWRAPVHQHSQEREASGLILTCIYFEVSLPLFNGTFISLQGRGVDIFGLQDHTHLRPTIQGPLAVAGVPPPGSLSPAGRLVYTHLSSRDPCRSAAGAGLGDRLCWSNN